MPNDDLGTGKGTPQVSESAVPPAEAPPEGGTEPGVAGAGVTKEELDKLNKRIEDLSGIVAKRTSERDKAQSKAEKLENEYLAKLNDAVTGVAATPQPQPVDRAALKKELASRWEEGGGEAMVEDVLDLLDDVEDRAYKRYQSEGEQKFSQLSEQISGLTTQVRHNSPEFVAHREEIARLREEFPEGTPEDVLLVAAREIARYRQPAQPEPPPVPGTTGGDTASTGEPEASMDDDMAAVLAKMTGKPLTAAEKKLVMKGVK